VHRADILNGEFLGASAPSTYASGQRPYSRRGVCSKNGVISRHDSRVEPGIVFSGSKFFIAALCATSDLDVPIRSFEDQGTLRDNIAVLDIHDRDRD